MSADTPRSAAASATTLPTPAQPVVRSTRTPRGPSPHKTELTRSEIVTAAIAEFLEVGITKATMDKIAKRARLAKGTLYLHFQSKEDLLLGTLEFAFAQTSLTDFGLQRQPGESMQTHLEHVFLPSMERFHRTVRADLARLVLGEAKSYPSLGRFYYERIFGPWHVHVEKLFAQAIAEGELHGIAPTTAAMLMGSPFWVYLASDSMQAPMRPGCSPQELAKAQIAALFGAYGKATAAGASVATATSSTAKKAKK